MTRKFKGGAYATTVSVMMIVIVIIVNLIFTKLIKKHLKKNLLQLCQMKMK